MNPIIIHADHLITMNASNEIIISGAVLIGADGRIQSVGDATEIVAANPEVRVKRLTDRLLMPGLINTWHGGRFACMGMASAIHRSDAPRH
jgi:5-methylthioadenosine/S-adenosylhomocysteine deaminase